MDDLSSETRERLNRLEHKAPGDQIKKGAADLRLLAEAHAQCSNDDAMLVTHEMIISYEPFSPDPYFLDVPAAAPNILHGRDEWEIDLSQWDKDIEAPEHEGSTATGQHVLTCARSQPPAVTEIVDLLNRSSQPGQLALGQNPYRTDTARHDVHCD
ncbi:hypothetical protein [Saccharopolyspora phatthalungensis]|uniref:Uncharacterized protein n=1 Tax=Saccharopolyspora phatthalungensis TaxID=664693 RepID=A0A840PZA7_9PSEU|nr:hypothetical protein [Saccharopolyspora phatthalungensis]MBB5153324.1 hypothetical protein [Saccharopolyspora phatthalungensis]